MLDYPEAARQSGLYLNSGVVPNGSPLFSAGFGPAFDPGPGYGSGPAFGAGPPAGRRALRATLARDRRTFVLTMAATLVGITAAVLFGSLAPLHSTWMTSGGHAAAGLRPPQEAAPSPAAPQGSPSGQAASPGPSRTPQATRSKRPPSRALVPRTAPVSGTSTGTATGSRASTSVAARTSASGRSAKPVPQVQVRYLVHSQGAGGFQGQVQVINHGTQPIAGWQIVVALQGDTVISISNASGFVSNGILLMQPAFTDEVVPSHGTLNVFFAAEGFETTPAACAFNGISCT